MQIVCTTDIHGYNTKNYDLIFEKFPGGIFLDSGDIFHGNKDINKTRGESVVDYVSKYTAVCPGNHDYLYGIERLEEISYNVPITACNLYDKKTNRLIFQPFVIEDNIGIIGVAANANLPKECKVLKGDALYKQVQLYIDYLHEIRQVDTVVILTHLPLAKTGSCTAVTFAKHLRDFDILLCGHAHKKVDRIIRDKNLNPIIAMQLGYKFNCYGVIDVQSKVLGRKIYDI